MIIVACPYLQTVRVSTTYHIPGESTSSPEHAGALYVPVGLVGALSGDKFSGTVVGCTTFSVQKQTGHPARSVVTGTWKGSYLGCTQGPTALTLIVKPEGQTGNQLAAKF